MSSGDVMNKNAKIGFSVVLFSSALMFSFQNCSPSALSTNSSSSTSSELTNDISIGIAEESKFVAQEPLNNVNVVASNFTGYDIIVIAGQSNAVGAGKWPDGIVRVDELKADVPELDDRILQVNRYEEELGLVPGDETLQHIGYRDDKSAVGFGMAFARRYVAGLDVKRKVILIPAARGGVSIDEWLSGTVSDPRTGLEISLLGSLRERLDFAMKQTTADQKPLDNRFVAVLWQHGEADIRNAALGLKDMNATTYVDKMHSLFLAIKRFHPEQDFSTIIGEPVPSWITTPYKDGVKSVESEKIVFRGHLIDYTDASYKRAYVRTSSDKNGLTILKSNCDSGAGEDCIHYDAPSQLELGKRYYNAYLRTVAGSLAGLRITNFDKFNASPNIVDDVDVATAGAPSHLLDIGLAGLPVKLGIDERGGGYVNYLELFNDKINRVAAKFGRGMQTAIRDGVHSGRFNPTQAGYSDVGGAKVTVTETKSASDDVTALRLPQFNVPLFNGDALFDFVEASKTEIHQPENYDAEGDWDMISGEKNYSEEIKSEFDYSAKYEKATDEFEIPAFLHTFYFAYNRKPNAILQFINPTVKTADGDLLLNKLKIIQDVSSVEGVQTPDVTDMSDVIFRTFSGRFLWDPTVFKNFYYYYKVGTRWAGQRMQIDPLTGDRTKGALPPYFDLVDNTLKYKYLENLQQVPPEVGIKLSEDLIILSNVCIQNWMVEEEICPSVAPTKPISMAYYYPMDDQVNKFPVVVMNRSDMSIHRVENRIMQVGFGLGYRDLGGLEFAALRVELKLSGILSPMRYENDKHQNRFEAVRQKIYMLFSKQPQEIIQAVTKFKNENYPQ